MDKFKKNFWSEEHQINLPVSIEENLLSFLSPTAPGTNYWDSPNEVLDQLSQREYKRIILQAMEIYNIINPKDNLQERKNLLDVGTGNGLVPRFLGRLIPFIDCVGIDPFLHGGHKTSWQKSNIDNDIILIEKLFTKEYKFPKISSENNRDNYQEFKLYLSEYFKRVDFEKFDYVYCKAIEHVPDWKIFAKELAKATKDGGKLIIKHRSFYSYLGPHRYSTSGIPWGHCILNDQEYERYINVFHQERSSDMCHFFFKNLSCPRMTTMELIKTLRKENMSISRIEYLKPKYFKQQENILIKYPELLDIALKNNKNLSYEEMTSGIILYVFEKL